MSVSDSPTLTVCPKWRSLHSVTSSNTAKARAESPGSLHSVNMNFQGKLWEIDVTATIKFVHNALMPCLIFQKCRDFFV